MVLYRKYRPQKIADLDIADVRERLVRIFSSVYLPHAYLFCGPKGTGKTSAARIVAKVLNCERLASSKLASSLKEKQLNAKRYQLDADIEPCNTCDACKSITEGRHMDILEIDAASNRGIEEIRDLRDKIRLAPVSAKYKVYIIDEVHMLTHEAFNALLKTLEEPPSHAVFILATTEEDKLPETIVSRCTRFNFHKANREEILHSLKRVITGEKLSISEDILSALTKAADGSFRDATKLLEQIISEDVTTLEKVNGILGVSSVNKNNFLLLLKQKKTKEALQEIRELDIKGKDFKLFVTEILNLLHELLLNQYGIAVKDNLKDSSLDFSAKEINSLIKLFSKVFIELRMASRPELPLEVAVVEWCEL